MFMSQPKSSLGGARSQARLTDPDVERIILQLKKEWTVESPGSLDVKKLAEAAYLLGVISMPNAKWLQGDVYNRAIDALDEYRDDWRGYVVQAKLQPPKVDKKELKAKVKQLRLQGLSGVKISKELNISLKTAYKWIKEVAA